MTYQPPFDIDKRFLLRLLDMQPIGVTLVHKRKIVFSTQYIEKIFGWKPDELIGRSTEIFFSSKGSWEAFGRLIYASLDKESENRFEWPFVTKDEEEVICEVYSQGIEKIDGSWLVLSSIRDITHEAYQRRMLIAEKDLAKTQSKELREQLTEQLSLWSMILENIPIGIGVIKDRELIHKNPILVEHLGYNLEKLTSECAVKKEGSKDNFHQELIMCPAGDNGDRYILFTRFFNDKIGRCMIITQDVTATVRMKKDINLIVRAKTEQAISCERLAIMGRLLSEIIHEINTPLTYMKTNLHVFSAYIKGINRCLDKISLTDEEKRKITPLLSESDSILNSLDFGIQKIENIVRSVKGLSKRANNNNIDAETVISDAIKDAIVLVWNRIKRWMKVFVNGREVLQDYKVAGPNVRVIGEHSLIVQLFVILLNNALEAARGRHIKDAYSKIDISIAKDEVIVSFKDNCGGIEDKKISRLFDSFYTDKEEGTGLGLWILKETMKSVNGAIEARNVKNPKGFQMILRFKRSKGKGGR